MISKSAAEVFAVLWSYRTELWLEGIGRELATAHTIEEALRITIEDDSKSSQVGDESSFSITEVKNDRNTHVEY